MRSGWPAFIRSAKWLCLAKRWFWSRAVLPTMISSPNLAGGNPVTRIGDCLAPSSIADAVYSGHRFAREFGDNNAGAALRRERPLVGSHVHD